uniref:RNA-directed RNA polymerase n=1 Tax=Leviviridae sp. TaxID=2027243 RepID=A0A514DBZ0_9VIRU|nr:MAG: RNA-dependent RNA polymerase [Leviviridae sp.]
MDISPNALYLHLLADLGDRVEPGCPSWSIDSTTEQVFAYCLRNSLLKKYNSEDNPSDEACGAALKKFIAINERCAEWSFSKVESSLDEMLLFGLKAEVERFWYKGGLTPLVSDVRELFVNGRSGPGASLNARDYDFYTKMFDSPLSGTKDLPIIWERCVSMNGLFAEAEASRRLVHGFSEVDSSRYSFVNKTTTIARGICTEPTINMWFQLGLGAILERRLLSYFKIDLASQPDHNRVLANVGSKTDRLTTIDLESASDSMSLGMLKWLLPRSFYSLLVYLRCGKTLLPNGSSLELNMVSTMGNGFTFPLQTMLFSCVVSSVARFFNVKLDKANFGVFGDDIICPREITRTVIRVLTTLGFTVNSEKTFVEGPFRESCGTDYFNGVNVRGVYIKRLRTQQDLYVAINSLNRWSAISGIYLNSTVNYLSGYIKRKLYVPLDESDDSGLKLPFTLLPHKKLNKRGCAPYRKYQASVNAFYILGDHVWTFRDQVPRNYNPSGLFLSLLFGCIRGYRVTLRQRVTQYAVRDKITPCWDYLPPRPHDDLHGHLGFKRFVDACTWNLFDSSFGIAL